MIIPSIDLSCGKAVQLRQGRERVIEKDHPVLLAREFSKFAEIAVIDLDAALGSGRNDAVIREICQTGECRVGGGIRSVERAKKIIALGAEKIIISTKAFKKNIVNHAFLKALVKAVGRERVIIAVDTLYGEIVTKGWRSKTGLEFQNVLKEIETYTSELLFTCVEREGLMEGTDLSAVKKVRAATDLPVTAAGGISTLEEIQYLSKHEVNVQIGMALYSGKVSLSDAFIVSLNWDNTLIPTITIDTSSQVLMLAYSSKDSLEKTFKTEKVWYYSRSRKKLWMKGERSGNFQHFLKVRTDCDQDALLITVNQDGHACHKENYSCFGNRRFSLEELYDVIKDRISKRSPHSYTSRLNFDLLHRKILEEAQELTAAGKKEEVIWETADLLYFVCVLLAKKGVNLEAVFDELKRRRRTPKRAS